MKYKNLKVPAIILAIGLIAAIAAYLCTSVMKAPVITEQAFPYSATYKLNGETYTYEDVYVCTFSPATRDSIPIERFYGYSYLKGDGINHPGQYTIAEKDGLELRIVTGFTSSYLMGDGDAFYTNDIYLAAYDDMGVEYTEPEILGKFDAELLSVELPTPIENTLAFAGFSLLYDVSMLAMLIVGYLTILACIIFVKRDSEVTYKIADKVSIVLNFVIGLAGIPFAAMIAWISQIFMSLSDPLYQLELIIPVVGVFTIAASLCLRRKGYTNSGLFIQLATPALFCLLMIIESFSL